MYLVFTFLFEFKSAGDYIFIYIYLYRSIGLQGVIPFILKHRARGIYIGRSICCSALQVFSKNTAVYLKC